MVNALRRPKRESKTRFPPGFEPEPRGLGKRTLSTPLHHNKSPHVLIPNKDNLAESPKTKRPKGPRFESRWDGSQRFFVLVRSLLTLGPFKLIFLRYPNLSETLICSVCQTETGIRTLDLWVTLTVSSTAPRELTT